jgi:hypothetical protein
MKRPSLPALLPMVTFKENSMKTSLSRNGLAVAAALFCLILTACGGGDDSQAASAPAANPVPAANPAPATPATQAAPALRCAP